MPIRHRRVRVTVAIRDARRPGRSRAVETFRALGVCLPILGALGLALSYWIYSIPGGQDLRELRGEVARVELVRPRRGAEFGLVTTADGEVLHLRWTRSMPGVRAALNALRPGEPITASVQIRELERPHHHIAWELSRGRDPILAMPDAVAPLERERFRFRSFCATALAAGIACLAIATALSRRISRQRHPGVSPG